MTHDCYLKKKNSLHNRTSPQEIKIEERKEGKLAEKKDVPESGGGIEEDSSSKSDDNTFCTNT